MDLVQNIWVCFVIAVAAASLSTTVTMTELFVPVRNLANKFGHMIGYLFQCFYCMSHWVVSLGISIYQPILISSDYLLIDLVVSVFFTITISTFVNGLIFKVFSSKMKMKIIESEISKL